MAIATKTKVYGIVLTLAAGALGWDRFSGSEKPEGTSNAAELLIQHPALTVTPAARAAERTPIPAAPVITSHAPAAANASPGEARPVIPVDSLSLRLRAVSKRERLDSAEIPDAFALSAAWVARRPKAEAVKAAVVTEDLAKAFTQKHALNAVMVRAQHGYAIVDGQCLLIGETCDGFRLVSVNQAAAVFQLGGRVIELKLPAADPGGSGHPYLRVTPAVPAVANTGG